MDFRGISWRSLDSYGPLVGLCSTFLQPPSLGSWVLVLSVSYSLLQSLSYHHFWSISYSIFMLRLVITSFIMCAGLNCFSCVWLFATLWTVALQAHLPMGFPGQEYCSGSRSLFQGIFLAQRWTCVSYVCCIGRWFFITSATDTGKQSAGDYHSVLEFYASVYFPMIFVAFHYLSVQK